MGSVDSYWLGGSQAAAAARDSVLIGLGIGNENGPAVEEPPGRRQSWVVVSYIQRRRITRPRPSAPASEPSAEQWLDKNIKHWGIETGLHARLDASRHDDNCRLRNSRPLRLHAVFSRVANSLCCHWIFIKKRPTNFTTNKFQTHMGEDHARRTIALVTARRPKL